MSAESVETASDRWRSLPIAQQPQWPNREALYGVAERLQAQEPLVTIDECDALTRQLARAGDGSAFLLQGGDCAELFADATTERIRMRLETIVQMALVITKRTGVPVIAVGRMAGQYAKPRTNDVETRDGVTLPVYRGDSVNGVEFTPESRTPDPSRLMKAYETARTTVNVIKDFLAEGSADLVGNEFYTSHEALILDYEHALTRLDQRTMRRYDGSAHFLWVGERTRTIDGAHIEFLSRIENPIAVKLGPNTTPQDVLDLIGVLNPAGIPGRLTLTTRMGADHIRAALPPLIDAVTRSGAVVTWVCDPMHGNTFTSPNGYKTRRFEDVLAELIEYFDIHRAMGTVPGGVNVEVTGDDVTEILGGSERIKEEALSHRYETSVDPRLNRRQSLDLALEIAEQLILTQR